MAVDILLNCTECRRPFAASRFGTNVRCGHCRAPLDKLEQLRQLLAHWYYPRRWRADLVEPSVNFLIEKLWTADGQGEKLYTGIAPPDVNYDIFRNMVTRSIARGVAEGWMDLTFPRDPLADNPIYKLRFKNPDRFAQEIEKLFPDVNWDEQIQIPMADTAAGSRGEPAPSRSRRRKAAKT
jgi:LSD1 subclass zinc finger protein